MSYRMFQSILLLLCILGVYSEVVEIPQGILSGGTRTNRDGGTYYSFLNIPFGKPPTGERRFKAPEAAEGWNGTRDATEDMTSCVQGTNMGQEDCLHLNVFTPELPTEDTVLKPVMVFIHGGGFEGGGGSENQVGAGYLLTQDVLLVAIQYRVGVFGFLSLDDSSLGATGNAGMKDQVLALQWIQDNIAYFGGDPDQVLIFGQSAGAMSVHLHILSPLSKGLFSKAISESGVAISETTTPSMRNNAIYLAEYLGIQTDDWEEMLLELQSLSKDELITAQDTIKSNYTYFCRPIVEIESVEPVFMPTHPFNIMKSGDYNQVPYLLGFNDAEESGSAAGTIDYSEYIPDELLIEAGSETEELVIEQIEEVYGTDSDGVVYLATDSYFGFPSYRTAWEQVKTASNPIYYYYFTSITELNAKDSNVFQGASHGDELAYLFPTADVSVEDGSVEDLAIKNMIALWTNFAIYGNPTPDGFNYTWNPVEAGVVNYLEIGSEESTPNVNLNPERMQFWLDLYAEFFPSEEQSSN